MRARELNKKIEIQELLLKDPLSVEANILGLSIEQSSYILKTVLALGDPGNNKKMI